ncbi:MAG: hypothetical protein ACRCXA_12510 [Peptostreptococcaceae bacterium]
MSRLKRLKERKRKQFLKTAMSSLALMLVIGSAQTITTYAWFTDSESINNDLIINTGTIKVDAGFGFDKGGLPIGKTDTHTFYIENTGTLKEHLTLMLRCNNKEIAKYINYELTLKDFNGKPIDKIGNSQEKLSNLIGKQIPLKVNDNLVVLNPEESKDKIYAEVKISIDESIKENQLLLENLALNKFQIDLDVTANQITSVDSKGNIQDIGFRAVDSQSSYLTVMPDISIPPEGYAQGAKFVEGNRRIELSIKGLKNINKAEYISGTGTFKDHTVIFKQNGNTIYIDRKDNINMVFDISNTEFNENVTCTAKLNIKTESGVNKDIYMKLYFRDIPDSGNLRIECAYKLITEEEALQGLQIMEDECYESQLEKVEKSTEPEIVESPKEEIEKPTEPEIVEPPKEEIEKPTEPEIVEPPKEEVEKPTEPDVVEPPKEEITELLKQPEAIQPQKEDEEIQE